ncbi:MAG: hypothetical protein LBF04_05500 [Prevotellaceae bacterium]|jgi:hypothetical protein|nr:hypothetical protein [Prevotellaceae bacterium]
MKRNFLISSLMVFTMIILSVTSSYGQNKDVRVALKGNAYMVGTENGLGLEVDGKLVVAKNYLNFQTDDEGKYFAVEAKDGKFGVCDSKGTFLYKCTHYKTLITGGMIRLQETENSTPKFYKTSSPTTEVKVTALDPNTFDPRTRAKHEFAEKKANEIAAQDPFAAFEFKTNAKGWQELYVDGKKLFEARTFSLISTYDYYKKTKCFFFIVTDKVAGRSKDAYGLFGLSIYNKDGKKSIETLLSIPLEYSYISPSDTGAPIVICTTFSGAEKHFTWIGKPLTGK